MNEIIIIVRMVNIILYGILFYVVIHIIKELSLSIYN
jgi:hypothetical protein